MARSREARRCSPMELLAPPVPPAMHGEAAGATARRAGMVPGCGVIQGVLACTSMVRLCLAHALAAVLLGMLPHCHMLSWVARVYYGQPQRVAFSTAAAQGSVRQKHARAVLASACGAAAALVERSTATCSQTKILQQELRSLSEARLCDAECVLTLHARLCHSRQRVCHHASSLCWPPPARLGACIMRLWL